MARLMFKKEFSADIGQPCPHFGGECLADSCCHWFPLPSAGAVQGASCSIERGHEPIHKAEAKRKAIQYLNRSVDAPDRKNAELHLIRARNWMLAARAAVGRLRGERK